MVALAVLIVGAWLQWKAYRLSIGWATRPVTCPEVGKAFQEMAHRDDEALASWFEDITPDMWDQTGELPVLTHTTAAVETQPRLGDV